MSGNKSQLMRLLFIDRQIREGMQSGRLANCNSMAAEYEVSVKTILRDIDYLKLNQDAPIAYDQQRKGYFYSEASYALPALHINQGDLFGLLIAQKGLEQYRDTPMYESLASVFQKIERSLPDKVSVDTAWLNNRISVLPEQHTVIGSAIWKAVCRCLEQNRMIRIVYKRPGSDKPSSRNLDPYHLTRYKGEWYLIGHCHRRGRVLTFALSRVGEAEETAQSFQMPTTFSYEDSIRENFGIFRGERRYTVRLRFSKEAAPYMLERVWHPEQRVQRHRDGSATLRLPTTDLVEIRRWTLSWGAGVRVLAPTELMTMVQAELTQALDHYQTQ